MNDHANVASGQATETERLVLQARTAACLRLTATLGFGPPLPVETDVAIALLICTDALNKAGDGIDPIAHTVRAFRTFLTTIPRGDMWTAPVDLLDRVELAASRALPAVLAAAPRRVSELQICAGMGSLMVLFRMLRDCGLGRPQLVDEALVAERLDHIALLADELDASIRRARLQASGNQIHRIARIRQADAAPADGALRQ